MSIRLVYVQMNSCACINKISQSISQQRNVVKRSPSEFSNEMLVASDKVNGDISRIPQKKKESPLMGFSSEDT